MVKRRQMKKMYWEMIQEEEPKPVELPVEEDEAPENTIDVAAEKKVAAITSETAQTERMQKRAEGFNVPVSLETKKAAVAWPSQCCSKVEH
ncbi:hypothetical protein QTO34_010654 [Cnephaeus nilssonii]|uniref:Uncharacterized protein n=1 Tax=Cnephaeus nilssonii TaxID=3371016 RepID=A0AA40LF18_CNENI|nr:hypothetical protein QTO34_010654 [Eptesicus nilssonii]